MTFVFFIVKITSKGPFIHWSKRVGKNDNIFLMPKIRTMKISTPQVATHLLQDPKNYLTPLGTILRKSSIDELPQIWSILFGHMSFVGPRPALFNQYNLIKSRKNHGINTLKPGLTGWAQINGRDNISLEEKIALDLYYLKNYSIFLDLRIIYLTLFICFKKIYISH